MSIRLLGLALAALVAAGAEQVRDFAPKVLEGHVSFLASDALEGRDTPSKGLEIAAEYVASQFRANGLEMPEGSQSYFQVANWKYRTIPASRVSFGFTMGDKSFAYTGERFSIQTLEVSQAAEAPVFKATLEDGDKLKAMADEALAGKVVLLFVPTAAEQRAMDETPRFTMRRQYTEVSEQIKRLTPVAWMTLVNGTRGAGVRGQLIDPSRERGGGRGRSRFSQPPALYSSEMRELLAPLPFGDVVGATASVRIPEADVEPVELKNVIGVVPGSDPVLKDSYVVVTAHYDHIGRGAADGGGDTIFNGANDDASGTATLLEMAAATARKNPRPKRTIVFLAVFGEEKGLLGTQFYTRHPVYPLAKTIANINLEHLGRTDDEDGPQVGRVTATGFDYSDIPTLFGDAAKAVGVEFYKHEQKSDSFFGRSDNVAFAKVGIPAHTFCVAFEFGDYHGLGDHWEKLDYANMAKVSEALAAGVWLLADRETPPKWNETVSSTETYRKAAASAQ
jgi:hypothetical protein